MALFYRRRRIRLEVHRRKIGGRAHASLVGAVNEPEAVLL